jgi:hypothetical protein
MPKTHALFRGGSRTNNPQYAMFPQVDVAPDDEFEADNRRGPIRFSITERITFKEGCGPCGCDQETGSQALAHYYKCNSIAVDDVIQTHILPRYASLEKVWWMNAKALPGATMQLRIRGNAASLGGTPAAPVPQVLHTFDLATEGNGLLTFPAVYFDQNDMLELVVTGVPVGGLECMNLIISPVVEEYCRGFNPG